MEDSQQQVSVPGVADATREQIVAEETYRAQVRAELAHHSKTRFERLLGVLNAPVALWLLSSIAAGGISHWYNVKQHSLLVRAARQERLQLLGQELWIRLGRLKAVTDRASLAALSQALDGKLTTDKTVKRGYKGSGQRFKSVPLETLYLEFYGKLEPGLRAHFPDPTALLLAVDRVRYHSAATGDPNLKHPAYLSAMGTLGKLFARVSQVLHGH